ncbi:MAG: hexitol phosphatase HxpB [Chitinophagaceae bacterium]
MQAAVIFDMDGLLVDSEPLWKEAADVILGRYGIKLSLEAYEKTTGLRTREFLDWWFRAFEIPLENIPAAEKEIVSLVIEKVHEKGKAMPGVEYILRFFKERNFRIGLASSSPMYMIENVVRFLGIENAFDAITSAGDLAYGKPHPEVYLNCANALGVAPTQCLCFEDSFNGMIAAKAAKMKCVVVPAQHQQQMARWAAADLKISSLSNFNQLLLNTI